MLLNHQNEDLASDDHSSKKSLIWISHLWDMIETSSSRFQWWWGQEGGWRRGGRGGHWGQQVGKWGGQ